MKFVFLLLYLFHKHDIGNGAHGGPAFTVTPMPSVQVCEKAGKAAKLFADSVPSSETWDRHKPAEFRCIEVAEDL